MMVAALNIDCERTKAIIFADNKSNLATDISNYELVDLVKQRSSRGFDILYENYSDALYSVINRIVSNTTTAEDLLQDTFVKIWKNIDSYDEGKGSLYTWMLNIARFTSIDHVRTKQHRNLQQTVSEDILQFDTTVNKTNTAIDPIGLRATVHKLEQKYREVIDIIYFYGYTYDETAKLLDLPVGTVKTRARKALQILRNQL